MKIYEQVFRLEKRLLGTVRKLCHQGVAILFVGKLKLYSVVLFTRLEVFERHPQTSTHHLQTTPNSTS